MGKLRAMAINSIPCLVEALGLAELLLETDNLKKTMLAILESSSSSYARPRMESANPPPVLISFLSSSSLVSFQLNPVSRARQPLVC